MKVSWIDIVILLVIGVFVFRNTWIGFLRGLSSLLGIVLGVIFAGRYHVLLHPILAPWIGKKWVSFVAFLVAFFIVYLSVFILVEILRKFFHRAHLSWVDRLLGFLFGLIKGILLISLIFLLLATFFPQSRRLFRDSFTYPYVVSAARFLVTLCPESWRARFNYNLRHFFHEES
jgi:membrane protein required for colicin V production